MIFGSKAVSLMGNSLKGSVTLQELGNFGIAEDGPVRADELLAHVAPATLPHPALHLGLKGSDHLIGGET
jgi:hypothetical protein